MKQEVGWPKAPEGAPGLGHGPFLRGLTVWGKENDVPSALQTII